MTKLTTHSTKLTEKKRLRVLVLSGGASGPGTLLGQVAEVVPGIEYQVVDTWNAASTLLRTSGADLFIFRYDVFNKSCLERMVELTSANPSVWTGLFACGVDIRDSALRLGVILYIEIPSQLEVVVNQFEALICLRNNLISCSDTSV